ncbi:hypothetical protein BSKO_00711 [Bryopsis sp. KO-2023]|nr:hypothetical protein BSKO_00711 [Bryopsis sp. KO-2023]
MAIFSCRVLKQSACIGGFAWRNSGLACKFGVPAAGSQRRTLRTSTTCMGLQTGIVGLPNVGKSTLFNAIVEGGKAQAANFPFCTIEPNVGLVTVPDGRLKILSEISSAKKTIPTVVEFVDIAGLVKGASKGEGLGNKFLANIREVDAIVQVVRCFDDEDVVHVDGAINPESDAEVINFELALADIAQIEKRLERLQKNKKRSKEEAAAAEVEESVLKKLSPELEQAKPARCVELSVEEADAVKGLNLLTMKPMIYAANINEEDLADGGAGNEYVQKLRAYASGENAEMVVISAKVEAELSELGPEEAREFLTDLGAEEGGLDSLVRATYKLLGLKTFFTSGEQETRAWTIKTGMTAPQAAGVIHTDFERGFICAETMSYGDFVKCKGFGGARELGLLRQEGKAYLVEEGDVMLFRFNV